MWAANKQVWTRLRSSCLLIFLLSATTTRCQEDEEYEDYEGYEAKKRQTGCKPITVEDKPGLSLVCRNITTFETVRPLLSTDPPGFRTFTIWRSPNVLHTAADFDHVAFQHLEKIFIIHGDMTSIQPQVFAGIKSLRELTFSFNRLTQISSASFAGLENIVSIDFMSNQISNIAADTFASLNNLKNINFERNRIVTIPDNVFRSQGDLRILELTDNKITNVNDETFKGLVNLVYLDLSYNKLGSLSDGVFAELSSLDTLNLDGNRLLKLQAGIFQTNKELKCLSLSRNNLEIISNFPLNIPSLEILEVNSCKIQTIPVDYLSGMNLKSISFAENEISSLESQVFERLPHLNYVILDSNNLKTFDLNAFKELYPNITFSMEDSFENLLLLHVLGSIKAE